MYPHSGFRSGGTWERTLVPVFVPGEHPNVPSFRFLFRGNIRQTTLLKNHPLGNPGMICNFRSSRSSPSLPRNWLIMSFSVCWKWQWEQPGSVLKIRLGTLWQSSLVESPRYGSSPNCPLEVPPSPQGPSLKPKPQPFPPLPLCPSPPHPSGSFCSAPGGGVILPPVSSCQLSLPFSSCSSF